MIDKDADHGRRDRNRLFRRNEEARIPRKLLVSRDPAQQQTEIHSSRNAPALANAHGLETNVVRIREYADSSAAQIQCCL